jgi:UbiD family decarboxylase
MKSWEDRVRPMEIAIAIGVEPISTFCAAALPHDYSGVITVPAPTGRRFAPPDGAAIR